ncbi:MAG: response regulator transcription factor [Phycisphaerae bacterium]
MNNTHIESLKPPIILVVEDDAPFRDRLARAMAARGYSVLSASDVGEAMILASSHAPDLALVDLRIGAQSGLDLLPQLRAANPASCVIILTGYGSIATAVKAVQGGAADYLTKPVTVEQILSCWHRLKAGKAAVPAVAVSTPSLDEIQWDHIQRILTDCGGNISKAAEVLGLHRRTLQRKLAKRPFRRT